MPDKIINWELLANPYNWLVIWGVGAAIMIAITIIHAAYSPPSQ